MAVDDEGHAFTPSPDPLLDTVSAYVADYPLNDAPKDLNKLDKLLSNEEIFGVNLVKIGMAELIKNYFQELSSGKGAVRAALEKYVS